MTQFLLPYMGVFSTAKRCKIMMLAWVHDTHYNFCSIAGEGAEL